MRRTIEMPREMQSGSETPEHARVDSSGIGGQALTESAIQQALPHEAPGVIRRDIIVIGASAGGLEALLEVVSRISANLPAAIFVVLHLPAGARSALASILDRAGGLPAVAAQDGAAIVPGHIYVAPPNRYHLILEDSRMRLIFGPRENRTRPAADPLFRSAARNFGARVIGVVLSGTGADGAEGLKSIAASGGIGIAQDPQEAVFSGMPHVAIRGEAVRYVVRASRIGPLLDELVRGPVSAPADPSLEASIDPVDAVDPSDPDDPALDAGAPGDPDDPPLDTVDPSDPDDPPLNAVTPSDSDDPVLPPAELPLSQLLKRHGEAAALMCPDCGGPLWEVHDDDTHRFECRVGHTWSDANSLAESQSVELERLAWGLINALAERAFLMELMSKQAAEGEDNLAMRSESVWRDAQRLSALIVNRLPTVL